MNVRFTFEAQHHIAAILTYIGERNPIAAIRVVSRIRTAAERLGDIPHMGRPGIVPGTREWVVTSLPYIIVYEVPDDREVVILGVYHGAQLRPGQEQER